MIKDVRVEKVAYDQGIKTLWLTIRARPISFFSVLVSLWGPSVKRRTIVTLEMTS